MALEDYDDPYIDEEREDTDEEEMKELEALLYSQVHHDSVISVQSSNTTTHINDLGKDDFEIASVPQNYVDEVSQESVEIADNDDIPAHIEKGLKADDVIELVSSEDDSDDDEDDGICVLPTPQKVTNPCFASTPAVRPETIKLDQNRDSDSDGIEIEEIDVSSKSKISGDEKTKPSDPVRKSTVLAKSHPSKSNVLAKSESSNDSDSSVIMTDEELDESTISLNLCGKTEKRGEDSVVQLLELDATIQAEVSIPNSWSKEMADYYNTVDHDLLNLSDSSVFESLSTCPADWKIDRADYYVANEYSGSSSRMSRYYQGRRCKNCNRLGHTMRDCPEKRKNTCGMCGEKGHLKYNCPNSNCLRCGKYGEDYSTHCSQCRHLNRLNCLHCGFIGHTKANCPDFWRRYHATTGGAKIVVPDKDVHRKETEMWCCNCGRHGHGHTSCRAYRFSSYPCTSLKVINYSDIRNTTKSQSEEFLSKKQRKQAFKEMKKTRRKRKHEDGNESESAQNELPAAKIPCLIDVSDTSESSYRARKNKRKEKKWSRAMEDKLAEILADEASQGLINSKERYNKTRKAKRLQSKIAKTNEKQVFTGLFKEKKRKKKNAADCGRGFNDFRPRPNQPQNKNDRFRLFEARGFKAKKSPRKF